MDTEYLKRVGLYILGALLSVGLVFYLGYHVWRSVTREVQTSPVSDSFAEKTVQTDGYIFRTETPLNYTSSSGGSLVPTAAEGENVRLGGETAKLYSQNSPDTVARIAGIEDQIALLNVCSADGTVSLKDSSSLDADIYSMLLDMRVSGDDGNASGVTGLRSQLITSVNKRLILTGSVSDFKTEIARLESEKATLTGELGSCLETITTPVSGYYYSETDGFETVFRPSLLENIDYASLQKLLSSPGATSGTGSAGKIVTDTSWYLVCSLPENYYNTYEEGDSCKVNFPSGETVTMSVYRKVGTGKGFSVIFTTTLMPSDFDYERVQSVELVTAEYSGFKIPLTAVRIVNGETGVYVLDGSTVRFRRISVIFQSEGSYIVETEPDEDSGDVYSWLKLHDNLITEGKGLYDGKVLG